MRGAVVMFVVLALAQGVTSAPRMACAETSKTVAPKTEILPSLSVHMARLGELMNRLFRYIGEPETTSELIDITHEMETLLLSVGDFEPIVALVETDPDRQAGIVRGYHACLARAIDVLSKLRDAMISSAEEEQKDWLLRLDQVRRDCHAEFG